MNKKIQILGGGTMQHVANHFALSAPAYGSTARKLEKLVKEKFKAKTNLILTRMAGGGKHAPETNEDIEKIVDNIVKDSNSMIVFFSCALTDWKPILADDKDGKSFDFGKDQRRFDSHENSCLKLYLRPAEKIIKKIRTYRKDIFLVGFKTTFGASEQVMFEKGLRLLKTSHVNLVLVNDLKTHKNMIVTPEEATYSVTKNRDAALRELVDIAYHRSHLKFTQSNVIAGDLVAWNSSEVPASLRKIVNFCVEQNAYKEFNGATVGHFAHKIDDQNFLTSIRRSNFNTLYKTGLVRVKTDGPDTVLAYGAKPSVGGQSQRIVFNDHAGMDCIVHFHCPLLKSPLHDIPVVSQREFECGSHECGSNTSKGLKPFLNGQIKAIMLDNHGPNIIFNKNINPAIVKDFITNNFDLSKKTGGYKL